MSRIRQVEFERTLAVVRRSAVADELEQTLRSEGDGGRPRDLAVDVLIAGMIHAVGGNATLAGVFRTLTHDLPASYQFRLGIRWRKSAREHVITYKRVNYLFNRIAEVLDYTPEARRNLKTKNKAARDQPLTDAERAARESQFIRLTNALVRAARPAEAPAAPALALDATSVSAWALPKGASSLQRPGVSANARVRSADRDATWSHQTRTHNNNSKFYFGHAAVTAASSFEPDSEFASLKLIEGLVTMTAAGRMDAAALALVDDQLARTEESPRVIADRGFSYLPDFADGLHERGLEQIVDVHPNDSGAVVDVETGALIIDGWPHAPWTPKRLHKIPRPPRFTINKLRDDASPEEQVEQKANVTALESFQKLMGLLSVRLTLGVWCFQAAEAAA